MQSVNSGDVAAKTSLLIVGNGMTSVRLVERLRREKGADVRQVTVIGEEPRPAYDRVKLTTWFEGRDAHKLCLGDAAWYREQGAELRVGERVVAIDRAAHTATT